MKRRPPKDFKQVLSALHTGTAGHKVTVEDEAAGLCALTLHWGPTRRVFVLGENFEAALLRAVRAEGEIYSLCPPALGVWPDEELWKLARTDEMWLHAVCELLRRGTLVWVAAEKARLDPALLERCLGMIAREEAIRQTGRAGLTAEVMRDAKLHGVSDKALWALTGMWDQELIKLRRELGVTPRYRTYNGVFYACYGGGESPKPLPDATIAAFDDLETFAAMRAMGGAQVWIGCAGGIGVVRDVIGEGTMRYFEPFALEDIEAVLWALGTRAVTLPDSEEGRRTQLVLQDMGYSTREVKR